MKKIIIILLFASICISCSKKATNQILIKQELIKEFGNYPIYQVDKFKYVVIKGKDVLLIKNLSLQTPEITDRQLLKRIN